MKIAIVAPEVFPVPPVRGGAVETIIQEVAERLTGHDVHILSISDPWLKLYEQNGRLTYYRYQSNLFDRLFLSSWKLPFKKSNSKWYYWPYSRWAAKRLKEINPDVIWLHTRIQFAPWLRAAVPKAKLILSLHNESNLKGEKVWTNAAIEACDQITSCSRFLADQAENVYPALQNKSGVLYNGVDPEEFQPVWKNQSERASLRRQFGLQDNLVILYAGRLVEEKGVHILIEAFKKITAEIPSAKLLIAGARTFSDHQTTPYIEKLKKEAAGLENRIQFLGHVSRREIHKYFLASDILAFPSIWKEPFGMTLLEGMATGLAVAAFNEGGPVEIVRNGENGILVSKNTFNEFESIVIPPADGFTEALKLLAENPELRKQLGAAARRDVENRFSWKQMAENFLSLCAKPSSSKVKVLIAESGSGYGGTARYLSNLIPLLQKKFSIEIVSAGSGPFIQEIAEKGWPVHLRPSWRFPWFEKSWENKTIPSRIVRSVFFLLTVCVQIIWLVPQIAVWLKRGKIQIVHLNNEVLSHLPLVIAAKLAGSRTVCHLHGWRPFTKIEKIFLGWIDELISISKEGSKYFMDQLSGRPVTPVPNGLNVNGGLKDFTKKRAQIRKQLGAAPENILVTIPGRIVSWKGQEIYLRALAKVIEAHPEVRGVILGHDSSENKIHLHHLKSLAVEFGIGGKVWFLDFQQDIWPVYAASDIVVHASTQPEPFGLVILEAMFSQRPVIATRGGGTLDLVTDQMTGLLVEPGNSEEMAKAIERFVADPDFARGLAIEGEKRARDFFTMNQNAEKIAAIYEKVSGKENKFL